MICRQTLGTAADDPRAPGDIDWVDLTWQQTLRRALRLTSRSGRNIDVLLSPGARLKHGDILNAAVPVMAICLEEIGVLRVRASDPIARLRFAFELGNGHIPAQITADAILTPDDGPARAIAVAHALSCDVISARFYPEPIVIDPVFRG